MPRPERQRWLVAETAMLRPLPLTYALRCGRCYPLGFAGCHVPLCPWCFSGRRALL